jgi:hypothetical protein
VNLDALLTMALDRGINITMSQSETEDDVELYVVTGTWDIGHGGATVADYTVEAAARKVLGQMLGIFA